MGVRGRRWGWRGRLPVLLSLFIVPLVLFTSLVVASLPVLVPLSLLLPSVSLILLPLPCCIVRCCVDNWRSRRSCRRSCTCSCACHCPRTCRRTCPRTCSWQRAARQMAHQDGDARDKDQGWTRHQVDCWVPHGLMIVSQKRTLCQSSCMYPSVVTGHKVVPVTHRAQPATLPQRQHLLVLLDGCALLARHGG